MGLYARLHPEAAAQRPAPVIPAAPRMGADREPDRERTDAPVVPVWVRRARAGTLRAKELA